MIYVHKMGRRLKESRTEKKLSAQWVVNYLNGYLVPRGLKPVGLSTYYSWEKIGTDQEMKGKGYPHPVVYKLLLIIFDITGYWMFNGDMGGRIVRYRENLPSLGGIDYGVEQTYSIQEQGPIRAEFDRVMLTATPAQRLATLNLLRLIR